jgi:hypothetical protein
MVQINFRSRPGRIFGVSAPLLGFAISSIPSGKVAEGRDFIAYWLLAKVNESISINQARTQPLFIRLYYSEAN